MTLCLANQTKRLRWDGLQPAGACCRNQTKWYRCTVGELQRLDARPAFWHPIDEAAGEKETAWSSLAHGAGLIRRLRGQKMQRLRIPPGQMLGMSQKNMGWCRRLCSSLPYLRREAADSEYPISAASGDPWLTP